MTPAETTHYQPIRTARHYALEHATREALSASVFKRRSLPGADAYPQVAEGGKRAAGFMINRVRRTGLGWPEVCMMRANVQRMRANAPVEP